jgi:hypothetical protein
VDNFGVQKHVGSRFRISPRTLWKVDLVNPSAPERGGRIPEFRVVILSLRARQNRQILSSSSFVALAYNGWRSEDIYWGILDQKLAIPSARPTPVKSV